MAKNYQIVTDLGRGLCWRVLTRCGYKLEIYDTKLGASEFEKGDRVVLVGSVSEREAAEYAELADGLPERVQNPKAIIISNPNKAFELYQKGLRGKPLQRIKEIRRNLLEDLFQMDDIIKGLYKHQSHVCAVTDVERGGILVPHIETLKH